MALVVWCSCIQVKSKARSLRDKLRRSNKEAAPAAVQPVVVEEPAPLPEPEPQPVPAPAAAPAKKGWW